MDTPLGDEITRVIDSQQGVGNPYISAVIHTDYGDIPALRVLNYDIVRHYVEQYADETSITVLIPHGKYAYRVISSRNTLELTVTESSKSGDPIAIQRFVAILKVNHDPVIEANNKQALSEDTMDLQDPDTIEIQLISKAMEQFNLLPCGGTFRRTKVEDLLKYLLLSQSSEVDLSDNYRPLGVSMVPALDATLREHIVIPQGMMVCNAPGYIQKYCGGIYSTGLSYYYQSDYWYIFPTYDYKRYETASRQLVVINLPKYMMPGLDSTYLEEGTVLTILATGDLTFDDPSEQRKRSSGNGVRFADAGRLFQSGVEVSGNKALMSRAKLNNEFVSSQQKNAMNILQVTEDRISSNMMYHTSRLASKEGVYIQLVWQNGDHSLLEPGMQTKIMYLKNGVIRSVQAVLIGVESALQYQGQGAVTGRFNRTIGLMFFAANDVQQIDNG